jgi:hypothetical protein
MSESFSFNLDQIPAHERPWLFANLIIGDVGFTRKPENFEEIKSVTLTPLAKIILEEGVFPTFTEKELFSGGWKLLWDSFDIGVRHEVSQFFVLEAAQGTFFVNTEGFDYCRYMVKLVE